MKNCWNCENKIPVKAKVCRFCGSVQLGVEKEKTNSDKVKTTPCGEK